MTSRKIRGITLALLGIGLGSALAIYFSAEPPERDPLNLLANKKYVHELRVMGGRSSVLAEEFMQWFGGLWHGQQLAGTITVLTIAATLGFRFVAARPALWHAPPIDVESLGRESTSRESHDGETER